MIPLRIYFLDGPRSEPVQSRIEGRAERLARFSGDIRNCEIWLEAPHGHHRQGRIYGIRIRLTVPGEEITIERQPETDDVYVSIREAFDAARRKLEDYERQRRGERKAHPRAPGDASRRRRVLTERDRRLIAEVGSARRASRRTAQTG